jgi:hypothetical protein
LGATDATAKDSRSNTHDQLYRFCYLSSQHFAALDELLP